MHEPTRTPVAGVVLTVLAIVVAAFVLFDGDDGDGAGGDGAAPRSETEPVDPPTGTALDDEPASPEPAGPSADSLAFQRRLDVALAGVVDASVELSEVEVAWREGAASDTEFAAVLAQHRPRLVEAAATIEQLEPPPEAPGAADLTARSLELRVAAVDAHLVAITSTGARDELDLTARRLRVIADRVGAVALVPAETDVVPPGSTEVPDWDLLDLSPLDGPAVGASRSAPTLDEILAAPPDQLAELAAQLDQIALVDASDPADGLGLLVRAEVARVRALAERTGAPELPGTIYRLAAIADRLTTG